MLLQLVHCWGSAFCKTLQIINESPPSPKKEEASSQPSRVSPSVFARPDSFPPANNTHTHCQLVLGIRTKPYQLEEKLTEDALLHYKCINIITYQNWLNYPKFALHARREESKNGVRLIVYMVYRTWFQDHSTTGLLKQVYNVDRTKQHSDKKLRRRINMGAFYIC